MNDPCSTTAPFDAHRLRALAAQGRLWLLEIVAWLASLFGQGSIGRAIRRELHEDLTFMRRGVAAILTALADPAPVRPILRARGGRRPPNAPPGFRRGGFCQPLRGAMRLIKRGRGIRGRIDALARVHDDLDAWTARMARRLERTVFVCAYVMVRAPADALAMQTRVAVLFEDSS